MYISKKSSEVSVEMPSKNVLDLYEKMENILRDIKESLYKWGEMTNGYDILISK